MMYHKFQDVEYQETVKFTQTTETFVTKTKRKSIIKYLVERCVGGPKSFQSNRRLSIPFIVSCG